MRNLNLQEQLNNVFIELATELGGKEYARYLKAIQRDLIKEIDTIDSKRIKEIVMSYKINIKDSVMLFSILEAITRILNGKLTKKEKTAYTPIIALMGIYSVRQPKQFASRVVEVMKTPNAKLSKTYGVKSNMVNSKKLLNEYFIRNEASISNSIRKSENNLIRANRRRLNTLTRSIRKDIAKLRDMNKSAQSITRTIKEKYKVRDDIISRNLDTELHAQAETVKVEIAKGNGATHKTWRTQGDARVRDTHFHNQVTNKRIPIDSEFRAAGMKANAPGDERLVVGERIRCRCYLVFD
jgi:hypothetical protein